MTRGGDDNISFHVEGNLSGQRSVEVFLGDGNDFFACQVQGRVLTGGRCWSQATAARATRTGG
jgi:hypothetical protein